MKITDIINGDRPSLSFEVFPPKTDDNFDSVLSTALEIAALEPSYMSVTYGAGGGTSEYTANIGEALLKKGVTPLSHLTCISSTRERIRQELDKLRSKGIENVNSKRKGDMFVITKVIIPEKITKEQRKIFEQLEKTELDNTSFIKKFKKFLKDNIK